jgi:hypothetical protein
MRVIPQDKANHAVAGSVAAFIGGALGYLLGASPALAAACTALAAGLMREGYNVYQGGPWSWADVAWTAGGGLPVAAVALV